MSREVKVEIYFIQFYGALVDHISLKWMVVFMMDQVSNPKYQSKYDAEYLYYLLSSSLYLHNIKN